MIKKIMHIMFLSCLKATELIEKKLHIKLSFKERLQLSMHKSMCKVCSRYEKQSIIIENIIDTQQKDKSNKQNVEYLKKHIIDLLEKKGN